MLEESPEKNVHLEQSRALVADSMELGESSCSSSRTMAASTPGKIHPVVSSPSDNMDLLHDVSAIPGAANKNTASTDASSKKRGGRAWLCT